MFRFVCVLFIVAILAGATRGAEKKAKEPSKVSAIYAMDSDGGEAHELASIPDYPFINSPEISPDGKWIAVDGWKADENLRDARVFLVNIENGASINLVKGCMPSWSADGRWIAFCKYGDERGVYLRSVKGNTEQLIDPDGWGIQWAPNGLKASYSRGGEFVIYDFIADTRKVIKTEKKWPYRYIYWNSKWSSDSNQICFLGRREDGRRDVGILDLRGSEPRLSVHGDAEDYNEDIAWHPDGSRIALPTGVESDDPGQIYVFDPNRCAAAKRLKGQPADRANAGMCWSPDGDTFYFISRG